ncbi:MAG: RhuM family protein [Paludibacter sp.]|nr:RhuM family protein [Paludibacter sp.]
MNKGEIIIYQSDILSQHIEVRMEDETVWLTQAQMLELFASTKQNISLHINNVFKEDELEEASTVKEYLTVQKEGNRTIRRNVKIYNLDVIISVGYRVKSQRGTQFRIWANNVLKEYLMKGYAINNRIERLENKVYSLEQKTAEFDFHIKSSLPPKEGIFYDGQIFDAYLFVTDIVKIARKSIILIDNYVDESVLMLLAKRNNKVKATIYTDRLDKQLQFDIEKHNKQYSPVVVEVFKKSHDRFLIIDQSTVYHIGASLKDLGKRWFAFSKMEMSAGDILNKLELKK